MDHLDALTRSVQRPSKDLHPIFDLIGRSRVAQTFKSMGYTYVHVGSWASFTASSPIADINLKPVETSELTRALYGSTALSPLLRGGGRRRATRTRRRRRPRAARSARSTRRWTSGGRSSCSRTSSFPTRRTCSTATAATVRSSERDGNVGGYLEQVRFANTQIERIVDELLAEAGGRTADHRDPGGRGPVPAPRHPVPVVVGERAGRRRPREVRDPQRVLPARPPFGVHPRTRRSRR